MLSYSFVVVFVFYCYLFAVGGITSGKYIWPHSERLMIVIRIIIMIVISSNIFLPQSLILQKKKTSSRMVFGEAGVTVLCCHICPWTSCHKDRSRRPAAEHLTGVSTMGLSDNEVQKGTYTTEKPLEKVAFNTVLTINWFLGIINGRNPL